MTLKNTESKFQNTKNKIKILYDMYKCKHISWKISPQILDF